MDERTHARYMSDIAYFLSKMEAEPNSGYFIPIALAYNKLEKYDETRLSTLAMTSINCL